MSRPTNGFTQGLPKKSGYYLFQHKPGSSVGHIMVKVMLPGDGYRKLVRFMDTWARGGRPKPDIQANDHEFSLEDPFITDGWYRPVNTETLSADLETSLQAAIQLLKLGDNQGARQILEGMLPDAEPVTLIRDAGGA